MSISYLDYTGLQAYDNNIKDWSNSANQTAFKTVLSDGNNLYFFKKPNATSAEYASADATVPINGTSTSDKLNALAAIIDTAATYDTTNHIWTIHLDNSFAATTVIGAINELLTKIGNISNIDVNPDPTGTEPTNLVAAANFLAQEVNAIINDIGNMDGSATIATNTNGIVTLKAGVAQTDGLISNSTASDITLAKIATTGAAEDISYTATIGSTAVTNVDSALDALIVASSGGVASKTVYLQDESAGQSSYAKVYKLYQGTNAPNAQTDPATLIGTINIPKDLVVQSGKIVTVTGGIDSDGEIVPVGITDGTYIKLTIQNQIEKLYINVADLIDAYTGGTTAEATVAISNTNEITVTINKIVATKVIYQAESGTPGDPDYQPEITVKAKIDAVAADIGTQISTAINNLDTSSDVSVASVDTTTGAVTIIGSIKEENGIINTGSANNVVFNTITTAQINNLFTTNTP